MISIPQNLRLKTVLVGDGRVGKTSLINRFCYDSFDSEVSSTVGLNFHTARFRITIDEQDINVTMTIWDCGGQPNYHDFIPIFAKGLDIVVFVFDLNSNNSFQNLSKWLDLVGQLKPTQLRFLMGTKLDLLWQNQDNFAFNNNAEEIENFLEENRLSAFYMSSSQLGINIVENFRNMAEIYAANHKSTH